MAIKGEVVRYWNVFKRIIVISLTLLAVIGAHAQYDPVFSHYWLMETSYNPAAAGKGNKLNAVGAYSMGFTGYEGSPKTFYVSADLPLYLLRQYHGVGASMLNDQIGAFTHQRLSAQYAFRKSLFGGMVSAGLQLGLVMEKFDGTKIDLEDSSDPAFSKSQLSGNALDMGFGLYYVHRQWYVGVSGQHLTGPTVGLGETNEMKVDPTFTSREVTTSNCAVPTSAFPPRCWLATTARPIVRTSLPAWSIRTRRSVCTLVSATVLPTPSRAISAEAFRASTSAIATRCSPVAPVWATATTNWW